MTLNQITKVKGPGIHTLANIVSNTISLGGIATASNFKTGTTNVHNVGVEAAGINVLGADTPIGTGATIYDAGGAVFTGVVTATKFIGQADISGGSIVGTSATFTGNVSIGGTLTYEDVTNIDSVGIITARDGLKVLAGGANVVGVVTATSFVGGLPITNGADNRVITASSASAIQGETNLYFNGTSLSVGGSNVTDVNLLTLNGTGASTNIGIVFNKTNSPAKAHGIQVHNGTGDLIFYDYTASRENLRIDSNGKIGVGGAASAWQASTASKVVQIGNASIFNYNDTYFHLGQNFYWDGSNYKYIANGHSTRLIQNAGEFSFLQAASGSADANITYTTPLKITLAGEVLIGRATKANDINKLVVTGTSPADNYDSQLFLEGSETSGAVDTGGALAFGGHDGSTARNWGNIYGMKENGTGGNVASYMSFHTRPAGGAVTERLRITSAGKVGIGTDSIGATLTVQSDSSNTSLTGHNYLASQSGIILQNRTSSSGHFTAYTGNVVSSGGYTQSGSLAFEATGSGTTPKIHITQRTGSGVQTKRLTIDTSGNVEVSTSTDTSAHYLKFNANRSTHEDHLGGIYGVWNGNSVGAINFLAGADTTNKDDGHLQLITYAGGTAYERLRITSEGYVQIKYAGSATSGGAPLYVGVTGKSSVNYDGGNADTACLRIEDEGGNDNYYHGLELRTKRSGDVRLYAQDMGDNIADFVIATDNNNDSPKISEKLRITSGGLLLTPQDYPNQQPSVDFNFVSVKKLDPRITYRRTGPASYVDEFGKVVLVGGNTPRFDHDSTTRECKGLLIEESRTNDWVYSNDLSKITVPGSFSGTQTFNTTTAPDGTTTADSHKGTGSSARHSIYWEPQQHTSAQLDNSSVYTCSVFVKQITGNSAERYCELETASHGTWSNAGNSPTFDLQNGTMANNASSGITGTIESYPDGWYRISMTSTTGTTTNDTGFYFNHTDSNSNSTQTLATSEGFHFWGAQIEKGNFITSYIPTSGSTATRGQGFAVIDGEELSDFYNPNASTVICQFDASNWVTYNPNKYDRVWSFSNHNTETDTIEMFKQNSSNSQVRWRIRTSNTNVLGAANYTYSTTRPKLGFAWQLNDAGVSIDGATIAGTGDSGIPLPSITKLSLGNSGIENNNGGHGLTGWIRRFIYYPIKVSDSQLVTLTS